MKRILLLTALAIGAGTGAANAQLAIGASIGTGGISGEAQVKVAPWLQLRGGYNYFQLEHDDTLDGVAYDGDLDLTSFGAFADLHPFSNSFVISGGAIAFQGDNFLDATATPTQNVEIGDQTFTPAQVGTLGLQAAFEKDIAPYIAIGWDTTNSGDPNQKGGGGIGFKLLLGAIFTGSPQVDLTSSGGTLSNQPAFQQEVQEEETNLQGDLDDYEILPNVQVGLTFAF
jgi:hypothetical protein